MVACLELVVNLLTFPILKILIFLMKTLGKIMLGCENKLWKLLKCWLYLQTINVEALFHRFDCHLIFFDIVYKPLIYWAMVYVQSCRALGARRAPWTRGRLWHFKDDNLSIFIYYVVWHLVTLISRVSETWGVRLAKILWDKLPDALFHRFVCHHITWYSQIWCILHNAWREIETDRLSHLCKSR